MYKITLHAVNILATLVFCSCASAPKNETHAPSRSAVDLCEPVTQHFLDSVKERGVKTIIRYYDYPNETIRGKTPKKDELDLIKKNGFQMLAVFQHNNDRISTFTSERGRKDALRAIELAKLWHQPSGSAIYYGVDDEFETDAEQAAVNNYAVAFAEVVRKSGYKLGAYGAGHTLRKLLSSKLVEYAWISQSTGFKGSKDFYESGRWSLKQEMPSDCGGINVDFNIVNPEKPNFGQWNVR